MPREPTAHPRPAGPSGTPPASCAHPLASGQIPLDASQLVPGLALIIQRRDPPTPNPVTHRGPGDPHAVVVERVRLYPLDGYPASGHLVPHVWLGLLRPAHVTARGPQLIGADDHRDRPRAPLSPLRHHPAALPD